LKSNAESGFFIKLLNTLKGGEIMSWVSNAKLAIAILLIVTIGAFAIGPLLNNINLGLDLQGGVHVELQAIEGDKPVTDQDMVQLLQVMRQRVDELGVTEPLIQRVGDTRLIVELAGIEDPESAVNIIGKTAQLEFQKADGSVILTGENLNDAQAIIDPASRMPEINLELNPQGAEAFAAATTELATNYAEGDPRRRIAIVLDGEILTNPEVQEPILHGRARITGGYTDYQDAANIAALLRAGALPVSMEIIAKRTVGPTLGLDSLEKSKYAAMIGLVLLSLFMLFIYRVPGFISLFSLVVFAVIVSGALVLMNATLTIPGIAGLLLSIAMAVGSKIIIFERIKDELLNNKTLRASIESGFKRAFWTIFDANVTTLIAAAVLIYFGGGPIRGFAVTLSIGILTSMFTAIALTLWLLRLAVQVNAFKKTSLFGVRGAEV
jgi:preprotein translocase subunit SecD